jgi:drug/metabolite transporter (DMT)-like permease
MREKGLIYAALVTTTIVWGGSFVAVKRALSYLSPLELLFMRFVPAALAFALLLCLRERAALVALVRAEWRSLCLMGLFGVIIYHLSLNIGEQLIPAGTASLVMALNPAFIFLLSVLFLGEQATGIRLLGLGVAFVGLFIVLRHPVAEAMDLDYLRGVLITLVAPISWAAYTVISRPLAARYPPLAVTGMGTILGAMPVLGTANASLLSRIAAMPGDGWASIIFLALLATVAGVTTWVTALEHLDASRVGAFIYLVPLWGAVLGQRLLGEPFTLSLLIGAVVIIAGVVVLNRP